MGSETNRQRECGNDKEARLPPNRAEQLSNIETQSGHDRAPVTNAVRRLGIQQAGRPTGDEKTQDILPISPSRVGGAVRSGPPFEEIREITRQFFPTPPVTPQVQQQ
jgi:hypothetical protein